MAEENAKKEGDQMRATPSLKVIKEKLSKKSEEVAPLKERSGQMVKVKQDVLRTFKQHPGRQHKIPDKDGIEALRKSITTHGQALPIVVDKNTGTIIHGHEATSIYIEENVTEVYVLYLDVEPEEANQLYIRLNRQAFSWDIDSLIEVFKKEELIADFGFTKFELDWIEPIPKMGQSNLNRKNKDKSSTVMRVACSRAERTDLENKLDSLKETFKVKSNYEVIIKLIDHYENTGNN